MDQAGTDINAVHREPQLPPQRPLLPLLLPPLMRDEVWANESDVFAP
ncbi:hypothetical protein [Streptomyces sp. NPDC021622]